MNYNVFFELSTRPLFLGCSKYFFFDSIMLNCLILSYQRFIFFISNKIFIFIWITEVHMLYVFSVIFFWWNGSILTWLIIIIDSAIRNCVRGCDLFLIFFVLLSKNLFIYRLIVLIFYFFIGLRYWDLFLLLLYFLFNLFNILFVPFIGIITRIFCIFIHHWKQFFRL